MFGIEPLARIVRHDARIEVKVPAAKGKKAYSYFREGGEGEKKSSGVGKKVALIGGGLALAGLSAAAIAMSRKKAEASGMAAPVSETKKPENNTVRNVAIGVGAVGLGAGAAKVIKDKKKMTTAGKGAEVGEFDDSENEKRELEMMAETKKLRKQVISELGLSAEEVEKQNAEWDVLDARFEGVRQELKEIRQQARRTGREISDYRRKNGLE